MTAVTAKHGIKLSLVGDRGIGKTSLLCCLAPTFTPKEVNESSYVGLTHVIGDTHYRVDVLEQNEAHDYDSLSRVHLRSLGWIVAFDLTKITTVAQLEQYLKTYEDKILLRIDADAADNLFLIGTKSDLADDKRLLKSTIEEFAKTKSIRYFETAAEKHFGVEEAFGAIIEAVSKSPAYTNWSKVPDQEQKQQRKKKTRCVVM